VDSLLEPGKEAFMKLCVSSREEHSIMNGFPLSRRIHLQDLTANDIMVLVNDTLVANERFSELQVKDSQACRDLVDLIVKDAEGVFLWVNLLLKSLEEDLATGFSSIASLQSIVRTTPSEL
jgi:hypothetical protein